MRFSEEFSRLTPDWGPWGRGGVVSRVLGVLRVPGGSWPIGLWGAWRGVGPAGELSELTPPREGTSEDSAENRPLGAIRDEFAGDHTVRQTGDVAVWGPWRGSVGTPQLMCLCYKPCVF